MFDYWLPLPFQGGWALAPGTTERDVDDHYAEECDEDEELDPEDLAMDEWERRWGL